MIFVYLCTRTICSKNTILSTIHSTFMLRNLYKIQDSLGTSKEIHEYVIRWMGRQPKKRHLLRSKFFFLSLRNINRKFNKDPWEISEFPNFLAFFTFSYPCNGRESIVFGSKFRNGDFDRFIRYEYPWIRKSHF